ncbi:DIL and ankyrin domain-containing protein [Cryptococcus neoformans c8]|nr:DIL and ankyrin domain-containing protein [Cryptococcus neoformans var. grubii AD1-83a]OXG55763.1 DIL and ankyrin domain-containing protein [Cryptococcus neoformans var. grubii MW-RSA1955]OXG59670.1 DIL and ankyrin domain-containing protein [Cryptococcus neoformans var. grubii CHC193]OXG61409.1 DIL and ankyrin domain-containing protein [Cryptococcus neoformans var. grubii c8]OXH07682.1 DIL and ankyrin domain-containing protein [Cryptococcus neoformans var. grubii A5-35-17]OXH09074.1 DIL and
MSNPPTPILAPLLTPCIPSSSGLSTPTFGAGSQSGYDGETPHVLQRAIMQGEDVPESPIIDRDAGTDSPGVGHNQEGFAGPSRSYRKAPTPQFLNDPSPQTILPLLQEEEVAQEPNENVDEDRELRTTLILRHALQWGIERGDVELVNWLVSLNGRWRSILDHGIQDLEDEEGWAIVGMAIHHSCGRQDREEIVRAAVNRWGVSAGPRGGRDRRGWTPLHLAVLVSTAPLISFLLSHGASPHVLTNRGLTPLDLVADIPGREAITLFLEHAISVPHPSNPRTSTIFIPKLPPARQKMLKKRRRWARGHLEKMEEQERKEKIRIERAKWIVEKMRVVEVPPELVFGKEENTKQKKEGVGGSGWTGQDVEEDDLNDEDDDVEEDEMNPASIANMLVFSLVNLPETFDILISNYQPVSQPLSKRTLPANMLCYYARFAYHMCDETWLEALIEGAIERIEEGVYENMENLAYLAFWAYNSCVLLHYLQADERLQEVCDELGLLAILEELINAIHVFVIRIAERRIDTILDAAILDYETLEDFNDIRFEGEWSLFRSFVSKKKRDTPKVNNTFAGVNGSPGGVSDAAASPILSTGLKASNRPQSMGDLKTMSNERSIVHEFSAISDNNSGPARITEILSGVLIVLQLYEVNPALIVQAFSQIYFWIACELFNRILTRKKYLCRSKALQIRMNLTFLDDWVRANGLPAQTSTNHFAPLSQLLQWLQCLSQITEFDTLIGTMQNMKAINPLQMRRAVREYRYEVNEGRMSDECAQYLAQLQKDWEKRRVQLSMQEAERRRSASEWSEGSYGTGMSGGSGYEESATLIDALFDGSAMLADFVPHSAPESLGELLDSRYMLPFLLPEDNTYLIATPPTDAAYANLYIPSSPFAADTPTKRPLSHTSYSSSRQMGYKIPKMGRLRDLPPDFFKWMKEKEIELKLGREALRVEKKALPAVSHPLGPSQKANATINTPVRPPPEDKTNLSPIRTPNSNRRKKGNLASPLPIEGAELSTTLSMLYPSTTPTKLGAGLPSPGLRSSASMNELREKKLAERPFEAIQEEAPSHIRSESYEMRMRTEMLRENSAESVSSSGSRLSHGSAASDGSGKKRWWGMSTGGETPSPSVGDRERWDANEDSVISVGCLGVAGI